MTETTGLFAGAVYFERRSRQSGGNETRQDHSVTPCLARPHGIEETHHGSGQSAVSVERHQQEFIQQFAACIRPAGIGGGADAEIISFLKERFCGFAVDFAGGSHDAAFGTFRRISQDLVRSFDIGADGAHGIMHDKFHADSRRQMNDAVRFPDKLFQMRACRESSMTATLC